jgi:phage shock protein C
MSTAPTANQDALSATDERDVALPLRGDTFLGVFEAIGEDLGFNANWLRIPFAALLLWNPEVIVASYLGLGIVVAVSRWLFPVAKRQAAKAPAAAPKADAEAVTAGNRESEELLAA